MNRTPYLVLRPLITHIVWRSQTLYKMLRGEGLVDCAHHSRILSSGIRRKYFGCTSYGAPVVKKVEPNFARYFLATSACRCNGEMLRMWKRCFYS